MTTCTPTQNKTLPLNRCDFNTLTQGLDYAAKGETGFNYYSVRGELNIAQPYSEIQDRAKHIGTKLSGMGLERHSRIAIMAETIPEFIEFFFACQYAGLMPVPLPLPHALGGKESYIIRLHGLMESAGISAAVSSPGFTDSLREASQGLPVHFIGTHEEFLNLPSSGHLQPLEENEPAYIQYSSGSTSQPKGVLISQRAITNSARATMCHGLQMFKGDRAASWLPLYHDMGLVGFCLTPLMGQFTIDYLATVDFAKRPLNWLRIISENRGTISFSPPFGYELCHLRAAKGRASGLDLSSWRIAGVGGDMVHAEILERFSETFQPLGYDAKAFLPSYGLAEFTLAATFPSLGKGITTDDVDLAHLSTYGKAKPIDADTPPKNVRRLVECGSPMPGHELDIRNERNASLGDREVGRVVIRGPSLMDGFYNNKKATRAVLTADGWLDTGDLGYTKDGTLVITGRSKDLIIINGRNIWPQDLEWTIQQLPGIRTGGVAVFSVNATETEKIVVIIQCRTREPASREELKSNARATVRTASGVDCDVLLVPSGSIPTTSSGKISRSATRDRYLMGEYAAPLETATAVPV